jgi:hypothetical protein
MVNRGRQSQIEGEAMSDLWTAITALVMFAIGMYAAVKIVNRDLAKLAEDDKNGS